MKNVAITELAKVGERYVLSESQSKKLLGLYGVAVNREALTKTADEAVAHAERLGYPVVLKANSPDIPHKTEAGVLRLNLRDADAVRKAYREIEEAVGRLSDPVTVRRIVVQEMVSGGTEMMVGASVDAQFGPLITCGFGGTSVEILRDVQTRRAPVSVTEALDMLRYALRGSGLLFGYRNQAPADVRSLAETVCRISEMISDLREEVAELDVNPIKVSTDRTVAVDALIRLSSKRN